MDYWNFLLLNLHGVITCQDFPNLFIYPLGDWELSSICLGLKASVNNLKCKKLSRQQPVMLLAKGKACWHMLDITNAYIALLRWLLSFLICRFYCIKALKCLLLISTKFSNKLIRLQHSALLLRASNKHQWSSAIHHPGACTVSQLYFKANLLQIMSPRLIHLVFKSDN